MHRWKYLLLVAVVLALVAVTFGTSSADESAQLTQRVDALEKRIATLEKTLAQRLSSIEQRLQQGGGVDSAKEAEAQAAFSKVNQLVAAGQLDQAKTDMADFMRKYAGTTTARRAARLNQELAVIGKPQPGDWGIEKWYQGESEVDLASDKATLLVFWEIWCPHCRREVPELQKLYETLKGDGLQLVGLTKLTRSSTEEGVRDFIAEQKIGYPMAKENGTASRYFNVSGIPAAAVVKDGKVIWRGHPARLSEQMLKGWL